jgi:cob(I)alamin adenosyltransferase
MKLYTRSGDDGSTGLFGSGRVQKDNPRVAAYGDVDELNACVGWAICALSSPASAQSDEAGQGQPTAGSFGSILTTLQSRLFDLGADLATPHDSKHESKIHRIDTNHVAQAEGWIDEVDAQNSPMTHFVLPGGTELAARLHICRTVCRRAERAMVKLSHDEPVNPQAITFINRVSDLLFAMARAANKHAGVADVPWVPGGG